MMLALALLAVFPLQAQADGLREGESLVALAPTSAAQRALEEVVPFRSGRVVDAFSGMPIAGATVEACAVLRGLGARPVTWLAVVCALAVAATFETRVPLDYPLSFPLALGVVAIFGAAMCLRDDAREMLSAIGYSSSRPILQDGVEDLERSRRLEIRFRLRDEEALRRLQAVLASGAPR